jgi:hypothetical protein
LPQALLSQRGDLLDDPGIPRVRHGPPPKRRDVVAKPGRVCP